MSTATRPLVKLRAQLFEAPVSADCQFQSLPQLLRKVADYIEQEKMEDPEFDNLVIGTVFSAKDEDSDDWYQTATLYYRREGDKEV